MNMTMMVLKLTRHITPWVTCENAQRLSTYNEVELESPPKTAESEMDCQLSSAVSQTKTDPSEFNDASHDGS